MTKTNLCVLFGGVSPEHEVSLRSAATIIDAAAESGLFELSCVGITREGRWLLYTGGTKAIADGSWENDPANTPAFIAPDRDVHGLVIMRADGAETRRIDCIFPALHGKNGEDGSVQGLAQLADIPCAGPGLGASAASMDKSLTKLVVSTTAVRQAEYIIARGYEDLGDVQDRVCAKFSFPVFVKPASTGSSVGISKVKTAAALIPALENALKYDDKALVEEFIEGREVEIAVLGNDEPIASGVAEIIPGAEFYDYEEKYINDSTVCRIPADIPEEWSEKLREAALTVYRALGCRGLSRVDFFVKTDGGVIFNEINTLPGFTSISMYPQLFAHAGIPLSELVARIVRLAMERK